MAKNIKGKSLDDEVNAFEKALEIDLAENVREPENNFEQVEVVMPEQQPANDDDMFSVNQYDRRIEKSGKTSATTEWAPMVISAIWIGFIVGVFGIDIPQETNSIENWQTGNNMFVVLASLLPIIIMWSVMGNFKKNKELRRATQIVAEVARQFIQPDTRQMETVRATGQAVKIEMQSINDEMAVAVQRANELENILNTKMGELKNDYDNNEKNIEELANKLEEEKRKIIEQGKEMEVIIQNMNLDIQNNMVQSKSEMEENISKLQEQFANTLENANNEIKMSLNIAEQSLAESLDQKGQEVIVKLSETSNEIVHNIEHSAQRTHTDIGSIQNALDEHAAKIQSTIEQNKEDIYQNLNQQIIQTSQLLDTKTFDLTNTFAEKTQEVNDIINQQIGSTNEQADRISNAIDVKINNITRQIAEGASKVTQELNEKVENVEMGIGGLNVSLKEKLDQYSQLIEDVKQKMEIEFEGKNSDIKEVMQEQVGAVSLIIGSYLEQYQDTMNKETDKMAKKIDGKTSEVEEHLLASVLAMETQIGMTLELTDENIANKTKSVSDELSAQTDRLNKLLMEDTMPMLTDFQERGEIVADVMAERIKDASENATNVIEKSIVESGQKIESLVNRSNHDVDQITDLLDRLEQSNNRLSNLMESSGSNLKDAGNMLSAKSKEFGDAIGVLEQKIGTTSQVMAENYNGMKTVSEDMLAEIIKINTQFNEQGDNLSTIIQYLEKTQGKMSESFDQRKDTIEKLTQSLFEKSEQLEKLMGKFSNVLTESVAMAEGRAQSLTAGLAESVGQAAHEATQRFAKATNSMKNIAHEVRHDLSQTRDEIRKSIVTLPEETRETTNAMRQVVSEQIQALKDLNVIVNNATRFKDNPQITQIHNPNIQQTRPMEPIAQEYQYQQQAVNAHNEFQNNHNDPDDPFGLKKSFDEVRDFKNNLSNDNNVANPIMSAMEQNIAPAPALAPVPETNNDKRETWVSELLNRASEGENNDIGQRPLQSFAGDIAQALDTDVASELWHKYQKGEKYIFNSSIYNQNGKITFFNISQKYNDEIEFKQSADQYIEDFETMIKNMAENNKDNNAIMSYLVSDTGKVYTMLAHAAGRFG